MRPLFLFALAFVNIWIAWQLSSRLNLLVGVALLVVATAICIRERA